MRRIPTWAFLMLLLGACAVGARKQIPPNLTQCQASIPIPKGLPRLRTSEMVAHYAIDIELARERERKRGNDCAAKLAALSNWINQFLHQR